MLLYATHVRSVAQQAFRLQLEHSMLRRFRPHVDSRTPGASPQEVAAGSPLAEDSRCGSTAAIACGLAGPWIGPLN